MKESKFGPKGVKGSEGGAGSEGVVKRAKGGEGIM